MAPKPELLRLATVASGGDTGRLAALDRAGTLPGRGAYLCRDPRHDGPHGQCAALARKRGALQRAFRGAVDIAPELAVSLESHMMVEQPAAGPASRSPRYLIDR